MSITLDFLLLFFLFIIPGLVFKRAYFYKEFSKQFSIKDNAYTIIFFSFIPGLIFQLIGYLIFWSIHDPNYTLHDILLTVRSYETSSAALIPIDLSTFIIHQCNVNVLAFFGGFLLSRTIKATGLDVRYKFFRFGNQWYYIFSGEIESFEKFRNFRNRFNLNIIGRNEFKFMPPIADILIEGNEGQKLYSGYLIDYDLNPKDIHSLDKVYLKHAYRYRPARDDDDPNMTIRKTTKVPIPGDDFILKMDNVASINLTFVPPPKEFAKKKEERKNSFLKLVYNLGVLINIYVLVDILFFEFFFLKDIFSENINELILSQNWFVRILVATSINLVFSVFFPNQDEKTKVYSYKGFWLVLLTKIILIVLLSGISYLFWK